MALSLQPFDMSSLKLDTRGLLTAVVQDSCTGEVRMVAYASPEALTRTLETGLAHFFSRSRGRLWQKGEASGHVLRVREVWLDCDRDAALYLAEPAGPTCHTGRPSCFSRPVAWTGERPASSRALPFLPTLEQVLERRRESTGARSYTKRLLEGGAPKIGEKIREEADEFAEALANESDERVVSEAADVIYHLMVGLVSRRVPWLSVVRALAARFGVSGLEEKAARSR